MAPCLLLLLAASLQTAQARSTGNPYLDRLIVDGTESQLAYDDLPLKPALDADAALRARMDKHGRGKDRERTGPCDIRGYHATWEIRDDVLYLVKLRLGCDLFRDVPLSLLFPGERSPVRAAWFTGELTVARKWGRTVYHVRSGAVTGSSSIERGTPDAPYLPRAMEFAIRPLDTPSCEVRLERDALVLKTYRIGAADTTLATTRIVPSEQQWRDFRRAIDAQNVWSWRAPYREDAKSQTAWQLYLEYMDGPELNAGAFSAFPDHFGRYRRALQALLGGLPCP